MKQSWKSRQWFEKQLNIDPVVIYTYRLGIYRAMKLLQHRLPTDHRATRFFTKILPG
jgi:hypothetical protein